MGHVDSSQVAPLYANTTPGLTADANVFDPAIAALIVAINENFDDFEAFKASITLPIPDQSIVERHIRNANVTSAKIAPGAVISEKIAASSVQSYHLDPSILLPPELSVQAEFDKRGLNVQKYGAKGDGVTDDTAAFNAACASGGLIYVPQGTYIINADNPTNTATGGVVLPSNTVLWMHPKAILKAKTSSSTRYNIIRIAESENIVIQGGQIIGDRDTHIGSTGEWGYGIEIRGGRNVRIEGVNISKCWGDAVVASLGRETQRTCQYITVINNRLDNCRRQGVSYIGVNDSVITGNNITNISGTAPQSGIDIEPDPSNPAIGNIVVSENVISGCVGPGIQVYGVSSSYLIADILIKDNMIHGNYRGIHAMYSKRINISENIITANTNAGILTEYLLDSVISNNDLANNVASGVLLANSDYNMVNGNNVNSNREFGIFVNNSKMNHVCENTVKDNYIHGIAVANALSDGNSVVGNYCIGNSFNANLGGDNIKVYSGAKNTAVLNNITRQGVNTNKPANGIHVQDGATTSTLVNGNDCYDGGASSGIRSTISTGTLYGSGNRNKDGTFSTTPN